MKSPWKNSTAWVVCSRGGDLRQFYFELSEAIREYLGGASVSTRWK